MKMKIRNGFVSNSSSSSFVIVNAGDREIISDGNTDMECCGNFDINIDELIEKLTNAKNEGATKVTIMHGGGYEG